MIKRESKKNTLSIIENSMSRLYRDYKIYSAVIDMREIYIRDKDELAFNQKKSLRFKDHYLSILSNKEIEYLVDLSNTKNKIQWIAGRYAVKSALFKYKLREESLMDLSCIDIIKGADSAPYLLQYPDINISISHSFPYCIAVLSEANLGIDLEKIFQLSGAVVDRFFTLGERNVLVNIDDDYQYSKKAIMYWTRKEAVSKFFRLGMKMPFKKVDTSKKEIIYDNVEIKLISFDCSDFFMSIAIEK
ncbi:4'-phosphopantetheinyl transferase family protein [Natronospora cellulosivora (SeqCode)]